jgi:DNA polymerase-3 subunit delta
MYKKEFDTLLKSKLPNIVLLYGDNEFLLNFYAKYYIDKLYAKETLLEHLYDDYNFERAKAYLSQSSLFGGVNLYILRSNKKVPKKELEELIKICNKNNTNYFLYIYEGSSKDAKSLQSSFSNKNGAIWVRFFEPTVKDAIDFAASKAKELNLDISQYAINHLVSLLNNNFSLINKELEKLSILNESIDANKIDELVYSSAPLAVEKVVISLFKKQDITASLQKLLELGEDEFSILRAIERFLQQLFLFHAYIKLNGMPNSKEILGYQLPKWVEDERASLALKLKSSKLLKIYQELLDLELNIKTKSGDKEALLLGTLSKIRNIL